MPEGNPHNEQEFIKRFNGIARYHHRYEVFRDFVTMSTIALHNAANMDDDLEQACQIKKPVRQCLTGF